jgi:oligopeptidase B
MKPAAPVPEHRPHTHLEHGVRRPDPFYWLRDREDPAVIAHLEAENAFTDTAMAHLAPLRERLFAEQLSRIQEDDTTAPVKRGPWLYYTRTQAGRPYPVHVRRLDTPDAPEEILLDQNTLVPEGAYLDAQGFTVSPDHRYAAWAIDTTGREVYTVQVKDLTTGELTADVLEQVTADLTWSADSRRLLYTVMDEALRPHELYVHALGTPREADHLVLREPDDRFRVGAWRSRDDRWLFLDLSSSTTTEIWYLPADRPLDPPTLFSARHPGCEYTVDAKEDVFWVLTNHSDGPDGAHDQRARNFRVMLAEPGATDRTAWRERIPHRAEVTLTSVQTFARHVVITEREQGLSHLRVLHDEGLDERLPMPEPVWVLSHATNPTFDTRLLRFGYASLVTPLTTYEVDLDTGELTVIKRTPVLGGYDPDDYVTRRLTALAPDGTRVPISVVHRRDLAPNQPHPTLLYGYGAYGLTIEPSFSASRLCLLDRGVIFAIGHVRGGGYLGRTWYEDGKLAHKHHSFSDFIACARHLVDEGLTTHEQLAIMGGSAGGLLMGAVLNAAPGLAMAAVAQVPFVDVVTTMLDTSIPLTTNEWEEWGDPRQPADFDRMLAWSPYDNVRAQPYPDLLVTSGLHDPRVQYWEPTKWVARLRERARGAPEILLKTYMGAGHAGSSGRYGRLEDTALVYAWLLDRWDLTG